MEEKKDAVEKTQKNLQSEEDNVLEKFGEVYPYRPVFDDDGKLDHVVISRRTENQQIIAPARYVLEKDNLDPEEITDIVVAELIGNPCARDILDHGVKSTSYGIDTYVIPFKEDMTSTELWYGDWGFKDTSTFRLVMLANRVLQNTNIVCFVSDDEMLDFVCDMEAHEMTEEFNSYPVEGGTIFSMNSML